MALAPAFEALVSADGRGIDADDFTEANTRFNQAAVRTRAKSQIFHGFAMIALDTYFNDSVFAEEPCDRAQTPGGLAKLNADYGHMLLATNRPKDAEPVLEQAVKDTPDAGDAWTDLGLHA